MVYALLSPMRNVLHDVGASLEHGPLQDVTNFNGCMSVEQSRSPNRSVDLRWRDNHDGLSVA